MGRRALRKIDPNIDLSDYLWTVDQLPAVCNSPSLFENQAPLELEVGSGKGLFMATATVEFPERNFLGIEVAGKYCRTAAARLARAGVRNGRIVHGDAMAVLRDHLADEELAGVHVYFPDPWWKKRHRKRRIMNREFLADVWRTLRADGLLHFWTDVREYFEVSVELIAKSTSFHGPYHVEERPAAHHLDYRTHFERRMRLNDLPVYRSLFSKQELQGKTVYSIQDC